MSLITEVDILDEAKDNFLTYSEEVLVDRAVPNAEDGLLSVHRKLIWTMAEVLKLNSKSKFKKSASVVGSTLASSYFHGDAACYGALCKLVQPYLMRYPLIDGDGNLGTQEGNGLEAAARYCVTGDTLIPTNKGLISIKEIAKNTSLNSEQSIELSVKGINGEIVSANKIVNSGLQETYTIELRNAQRIKATNNHPILTLDNNLKYKWKTVNELNVGDKVLLPLYEDNIIGFGENNDLVEAAMLGCMISEGYATVQNRIGINNQDMDMIAPVMNWVAANWGEKLGCLYYNEKLKYYEYSVANTKNYNIFLSKYEFEKSKNKHLPKVFMNGTKKYQATVLSYLFEGDGCVDIGHGITYSSISEELIRQLQLVLQQNFGIFSYITVSTDRDEIHLCINKISLQRFKKQIDFISDRKKEKLNEVIRIFQEKRWANTNYAYISEINNFLRKKYPSQKTERYNNATIKNYQKIQSFIEEKDFNRIKYLINNFITIEIVSKTKNDIKEPVFCFTVDSKDHAFIGNGFINHNTNVKMSQYADLMMLNFKKNVVPLKETYNGEYMEPVILPSILPNAIVNGRESIAIGLSHNSLPCNLSEVCDGIIEYINNNNISVKALMQFIKGPDFPLGGRVINAKDIEEAFKTGRSGPGASLKVQGDYEIDGRNIIFTTIPYRTYRNKIKEQIAKNADKLEEVIDDFNDESNVGKNRLVFSVKDGVSIDKALTRLFTLTDLQTTLSYNMNFIVNGTPKMCSIIDLIQAYVIHQHNIMIAAATYDKTKAEEKAHILVGLIAAVDVINEVIKLIKSSKDKDEAIKLLMSFLSIDSIQAKAILNMKLGKLTRIDKEDLLNELDKQNKIIIDCKQILESKQYRDELLIQQLQHLKTVYGDNRRTQLLNIEVPREEKEIQEVIPEDVIVTIGQSGDIKRVPKSLFKVQKRNGRGVKNEDDAVLDTISTNTIDNLMLFTSKGKMYRMLVDNIPIGTNSSKGIKLGTLITMESDEKVIAASSFYKQSTAKYVAFITKKGLIKKTKLEEYTSIKRSTGITAIKLKEGDSLANVTFLNTEEMIIITKKGSAIHFSTEEITPIGRITSGVKSIKLDNEDEVVIGLPINKITDHVAIITGNGYGKKCSIDEFPFQARAGKGVSIYKPTEITGDIVGAEMINDNDTLLLTGKPTSICISATDIPFLSRISIGNIMVKSKIISVVKL